LSKKIGTALANIGEELVKGHDIGKGRFIPRPNCVTEFKAPKCGCGGGGGALGGFMAGFAAGGGFSSFPEGTEVLTPTGRVAIETLREGDLVIARNEETGQTGAFPVTGLMSRTSPGVIWLTLSDISGATTRMGVTSEHPLFVAGQGWLTAGEITAGDEIRNTDLKALKVLATEIDDKPVRVHNLEVADAHTYFAGELDAWGHNAGRRPIKSVRDGVLARDGCKCRYCGSDLDLKSGSGNSLELDHYQPFSEGGGRGLDNIVCSCRTCNRGFGNAIPGKGKKPTIKF